MTCVACTSLPVLGGSVEPHAWVVDRHEGIFTHHLIEDRFDGALRVGSGPVPGPLPLGLGCKYFRDLSIVRSRVHLGDFQVERCWLVMNFPDLLNILYKLKDGGGDVKLVCVGCRARILIQLTRSFGLEAGVLKFRFSPPPIPPIPIPGHQHGSVFTKFYIYVQRRRISIKTS